VTLEGKIALVTGAGSGIGRAIALGFAKRGADVVVDDVNSEVANKVAEEIKALGRKALAIQADVTKKGEVNEMVKIALEKFGKIDILVNNVGSFVPYVNLVDTEEDFWDRKMEINLKGTYLCTRAVVKQMIKQKKGKIVNVASDAGKIGYPGESAYCAAKFGVVGFTQVAARELAQYGINVNAVCPGVVDTPMMEKYVKQAAKEAGKSFEEQKKEFISLIPLGRFAKPEDIANLVAFLASHESDYITGQSMNITGGLIFH
jgi:Dehydrogenases with different specificities (related to short-chain alcohol dehydrogenases)